jgi:hypothetical protein
MDLDADTGGYNLQAAFSTGFVAGEEAAAIVCKPSHRKGTTDHGCSSGSS